MANKKLGFIPLFRSIQENWLWQSDDPFDIRSAWIDILLSVNHENKKINVGRSVVTIHAGQMWTSYVKLARRWNWSRPRVDRYIKMLKMDGMIYVDGTPNGTLLTVVNYDNFAYHGNTNDTTDVTTNVASGVTSDVTPGVTQTININNIDNLDNRKKGLGSAAGGDVWQ